MQIIQNLHTILATHGSVFPDFKDTLSKTSSFTPVTVTPHISCDDTWNKKAPYLQEPGCLNTNFVDVLSSLDLTFTV